jgi:KTSC domain-containing protein
MPLTLVHSTAFHAVAYNVAARILYVHFHDGRTYQYFGVPAAVHAALLRAPSKGAFFNHAIRERFPCVPAQPGPEVAP